MLPKRKTDDYKQIAYQLQASTLTLLVTWIGTDHTNNAITADDFAITANALDRGHYFHDISPRKTD